MVDRACANQNTNKNYRDNNRQEEALNLIVKPQSNKKSCRRDVSTGPGEAQNYGEAMSVSKNCTCANIVGMT